MLPGPSQTSSAVYCVMSTDIPGTQTFLGSLLQPKNPPCWPARNPGSIWLDYSPGPMNNHPGLDPSQVHHLEPGAGRTCRGGRDPPGAGPTCLEWNSPAEVDVTRPERGPPAWSGTHLPEVDVTRLEWGPQYCRGTAVLLKYRSTVAVLLYCSTVEVLQCSGATG